ncbi:MAG: serine dehydratase beta chain [Eggerthella lenta]
MKTLGHSDVIGPIMVGPSSSHTAGALRIAYMARRLCLAEPKTVEFRLLGSFAHTLTGHGTDKALVAGMLGLAADDLRIRDSSACARGGTRVLVRHAPTRSTTIPTPSTCASWTPRATR